MERAKRITKLAQTLGPKSGTFAPGTAATSPSSARPAVRGSTPARPAPGTASLAHLRKDIASQRPALFFAATTRDYPRLREASVARHFERYGALEDVRITKDVVTHRPTKWGLVQFVHKAELPAELARGLPGAQTEEGVDPVAKALRAGTEVAVDGILLTVKPGLVVLKSDKTNADHFNFRGFLAEYRRSSHYDKKSYNDHS
ncbi:hypothetical protein H9P43_003118 [Blastocladiella emersonii ATCC 22665]|nr:hypothetical protein H9P43_003118 [Blastocladiella emersonii ATCC 22665]